MATGIGNGRALGGGFVKVGSRTGEVQSHMLQGRRVVVALESQELSSSHPLPALGEFVPAGQAAPPPCHPSPSRSSFGAGGPPQLPAAQRGCRDELTSLSCRARASGSAAGVSLVERGEIHSRGCREAVSGRAGGGTEQEGMGDAQGSYREHFLAPVSPGSVCSVPKPCAAVGPRGVCSVPRLCRDPAWLFQLAEPSIPRGEASCPGPTSCCPKPSLGGVVC